MPWKWSVLIAGKRVNLIWYGHQRGQLKPVSTLFVNINQIAQNWVCLNKIVTVYLDQAKECWIQNIQAAKPVKMNQNRRNTS